MKIGILFGGPAREREISFSGGKTAMENIDKSLFIPIPVFVDCCGNFIILKEELIYKNQIRDFYPPKSYQPANFSVYLESLGKLSDNELALMISEIGEKITPDQFHKYFDFAFIAMHGPGAEDGAIQGLMEWYGMPYSGPGILGSGVGIDKIAQNDMLRLAVGLNKKTASITRNDWENESHRTLFEKIKANVGLPFVVKAPHQGSSIGVAFVKKDSVEDFENAAKQCFFIKEIEKNVWQNLSPDQKIETIQKIVNLNEGIGFPLTFNNKVIFSPVVLLDELNIFFATNESIASLISTNSEDAILFESFVNGQEFSCGVIQTAECEAVALPPTEIIKVVEVFDFDSKYKAGATRKNMPIDTSLVNNYKAQEAVKTAFEKLGFGVCTRIDGFVTSDDEIVLHDPNTIPGMSPTSLIFKQMAEIGFNVTDAITYFIRQSIRERIRSGKMTFKFSKLLKTLDAAIALRVENLPKRKQVAVLFGGFDKDIIENTYSQAKKEFGKLAASLVSFPVPIFISGTKENPIYQQIPTQLMFKEYAEDMLKIMANPVHPLLVTTRKNAASITKQYMGNITFEVKNILKEELAKNFNIKIDLVNS